MIEITITGETTGKRALLYEFPRRKGRRRFVPTYNAFARCHTTKELFLFSVVRDSSLAVFGTPRADPYGRNGECPPCKDAPYHGIVREDGSVGFRIQLFEAECKTQSTLIGHGTAAREEVQIHFGAAASFGCLLVAGRRRSYHAVFEKKLRRMLIHSSTIRVMVRPRVIPLL